MTGDSPHAGRAQVAYELNRFEEAASHARLAVADEPDDAMGYYWLGHALFMLKRYDDALEAAESGIAINPEFALLFALRALPMIELNRDEAALESANQATTLEPENAYAQCILGRCFRKLERYEEAMSAFDRAIELEPESAHHRHWKGLTLLDDLGRPEEAEREYREALRLDASEATYLNNLGVALDRQNKSDEATLAYKAAVLMDPSIREAKSNTLNTVRRNAGLVGGLGVLGLILAKMSTKLMIVFFALRAAVVGNGTAVLSALLFVVVAIAAGFTVRKRLRIRRLKQLDPGLYSLYERLQKDEKAGRL